MQPFFSFERFDRLLKSADMEAMLFCRPSSYRYFTTLPWYERVHFSDMPGQYVLPAAGYIRGRPDQAFATASSRMDYPDFKAQKIWISDIRPVMSAARYDRHAELIIRLLDEKGIQSGRVGIERGTLPHDLVAALDGLAPRICWVECREELFKLQEFKSAAELDRLRTSCRITERGMMRVLDRLATGVTPEELMEVYVKATAGLYTERYGHFFSVHFKDYHFTDRELKGPPLSPETLIHIDVSSIHKGLISDIGRNFYFGDRVPPQVERCSRACTRTTQVVLDRLKPGIRCAEVDSLSKEVLFDLLGDPTGLNVGFHSHGIGWILYSYPLISPEPEGEILPGHTFTLEYKVKYPGIGHFKCEDTFAMHEDGPECLGGLERKLFVKSGDSR